MFSTIAKSEYQKVQQQSEGECCGDAAAKPSHPFSRLRTITWVLFVVASMECLMLVYMAKQLKSDYGRTSLRLRSPVPKFNPITTNFAYDAAFRGLGSAVAVQRAWQPVMSVSPTLGFIRVDNPQQYDLQPNKNVLKGTQNAYMVSFYHQLHCLQELQSGFADAFASNSTPRMEPRHAEHCISYLRQAVMCAGDMTLEGHDAHPEMGESPLRGYGVPHLCKDWNDLERWMHDHAAE